jgi:hypothetical protein
MIPALVAAGRNLKNVAEKMFDLNLMFNVKKIFLIILGLFSLAEIVQVLSALYLSLQQLIRLGSIVDPNTLEFAEWLMLPTILGCFLFYKLAKNPNFFNEYKRTSSFFVYGIIITVAVVIVMNLLLIMPHGDGMDFLSITRITMIGFLISFFLAVIGFIYDRKKSKTQLSKKTKMFLLALVTTITATFFFSPRRSTEMYSDNIADSNNIDFYLTRDCKCLGIGAVAYSDNYRGSSYKCYGIPICEETNRVKVRGIWQECSGKIRLYPEPQCLD